MSTHPAHLTSTVANAKQLGARTRALVMAMASGTTKDNDVSLAVRRVR